MPLRETARAVLWRVRRLERREVREFRDWIEHTDHLIHVSILVFLPLLIGLVTLVSNRFQDLLPFLLFPPLASGTYTLFANPESKYASPRRFVGGLTIGAVCGWIALELSARYWYDVPPGEFTVHAGAAAFAVFLTAVVTWALDLEESSAFSTALLVLVTGATQLAYVASVAVSTTLVAGVFVTWRDRFYEQRAEFLYQTTGGDDHVLVPMRGDHPHATAMFAANLAAPHDAGKVVLLDIVDDETIAEAERTLLEAESGRAHDGEDGDGSMSKSAPDVDVNEEARDYAVAEATTTLENRAHTIETEFDVPCEVMVAVDGGDPTTTIRDACETANCDLITVPYESRNGKLSGTIRGLFAGDTDVIVHRSQRGEMAWSNALVTVRKTGDVAHAMLDFALRLVHGGEVSVCHCIDSEGGRRRAEEMLANLVEAFDGDIETRVSTARIEAFLERNDDRFDLVFMGASTDRSTASRFLSKPTFERIGDVETDVAIVHRR